MGRTETLFFYTTWALFCILQLSAFQFAADLALAGGRFQQRKIVCLSEERRRRQKLFASRIENEDESSDNKDENNIKLDMADLQKQVDELRNQIKADTKVEEFRIKKKKKQESNMEELDRIQRRLSAFESQYELSIFQQQSKELLSKVQEVWVLLYNTNTADQGIYSLSLGNQNIVLGWQSKKEAQAYAMMLKAQEWFVPQPHLIPTKEMLEFSRDSGHSFEIVPEGSGFYPPETNKEQVDFDPTQIEQPAWKPATDFQDPEMFSIQELNDIRSDLNNLFGDNSSDDWDQ